MRRKILSTGHCKCKFLSLVDPRGLDHRCRGDDGEGGGRPWSIDAKQLINIIMKKCLCLLWAIVGLLWVVFLCCAALNLGNRVISFITALKSRMNLYFICYSQFERLVEQDGLLLRNGSKDAHLLFTTFPLNSAHHRNK